MDLGEEASIQRRESGRGRQVSVFLVFRVFFRMLVDADGRPGLAGRAPKRGVRAVRSRLTEAKTLSESYEVSYVIASLVETPVNGSKV